MRKITHKLRAINLFEVGIFLLLLDNESKLFFEDGFAALNRGWHIPEDDNILNCPDGPSHSDHNFHEER